PGAPAECFSEKMRNVFAKMNQLLTVTKMCTIIKKHGGSDPEIILPAVQRAKYEKARLLQEKQMKLKAPDFPDPSIQLGVGGLLHLEGGVDLHDVEMSSQAKAQEIESSAVEKIPLLGGDDTEDEDATEEEQEGAGESG
ncbi:unnamed protein product, partial [Amoebophrya sp. A25]